MKKILITLITFFLCSQSHAQWIPSPQMDFSAGLNDGFSAVNIKDNEAAAIQNLVFTTGGNIQTRAGSAKINTVSVGSSTAGTGIFFYKQADGDRFLVSVWDDDTILKMEYGVGGGPDGIWDDITGSLSFSASATDFASFAVGEDILVIEDGIGTTAPYKWDGTGDAVALGGSPPNAKYVAFHKNMMFFAGDDADLSLLSFTDVGDIENSTTGLSGNVAVETNDGTIIRGIVSGYDALYIFKDRSIWRLSGSDKDSFVLQRVVTGEGTLTNNAIQQFGGDMFFPSEQGDIFLYDGAANIKDISKKIEGTLDGLAFDRFDNAPAALVDDDYYISVTTVGGSKNSVILVFDTFHLAWTKFVGMNANAMARAEDSNGKDMLVFLDYTGFAYQYPSGTDDAGTAISDFWLSKQYRFPQMSTEKYVRLIKIFANQKGNYNLNLELRSDFEGSGMTFNINLLGVSSSWDTAIYDVDVYGGQNLIVGRAEPEDKGVDFFQFRFFNENANEPWELNGFIVFLEGSSQQ